jgi:putative membrane protein
MEIIIQIILSILIGILFGIITGITPGIHVNLVCAALLSIIPLVGTYFSPLPICAFIASLAVTHSFLDTIPSTFLGAPNEQNALSALPSQKMLLAGQGYAAVKITIAGAFAGLLLALCLIPIFSIVAPWIAAISKSFVKYVLVLVILFMLFREKNKLWAIILFSFAGLLGSIVLMNDNFNQPLFLILSGLFGISGLLMSFFENTQIPTQHYEKTVDIEASDFTKATGASVIGAFLIQFLPGTGPSHGAIASSQLFKTMGEKTYLALVGAMGTMSTFLSLVTFYTLEKAKDGSIVAISQIMPLDFFSFTVLILSFIIAGSIAVILTLYLSKKFSILVMKVNYNILAITIMAFIAILAFCFDGILGIVVLLTAAAIGLIAPLKNIARNHLMGVLIIPVLCYLFL